MSRPLLIACALLTALPVGAAAQARRPPARQPAVPRVEVGGVVPVTTDEAHGIRQNDAGDGV